MKADPRADQDPERCKMFSFLFWLKLVCRCVFCKSINCHMALIYIITVYIYVMRLTTRELAIIMNKY